MNRCAIDQLERVSLSLKSLASVEEGDKYYYDPVSACFYKSGAPIVDFVSYVWGKGYTTKLLTGCCRTVSGESHSSFATGLNTIERSVNDAVEAVRDEAFLKKMDFMEREALLERVRVLNGKVVAAAAGIQRLMSTTYKEEPIKAELLEGHHNRFSKTLSTRIRELYVEMVRLGAREEKKFEESLKSDEERLRFRKKRQEDLEFAGKYEDQIRQAEKDDLAKSTFLRNNEPNPITGLSIQDLTVLRKILFSEKNSVILQQQLDRKLKENVLNPYLYLRPKCTNFPLPVQYWYDGRLAVHLKGSRKTEDTGRERKFLGRGEWKVVSLTVVFENKEDLIGKVFANGVSKIPDLPEDPDPKSKGYESKTQKRRAIIQQRQVAKNERYFMRLFQGTAGIVQLYSVSRYLGVDKSTEKQSILTEYYNLGDVGHYLKHKHLNLSDKQKLHILTDVSNGLERIHKEAVHMDIKPDNILLEDVSERALKNGIGAAICDFGFCCRLGKTIKPRGARFFIAPEVVNAAFSSYNNIGTPADIWSLGCTGWLLFTGKLTPVMVFLQKQEEEAKRLEKESMKPVKRGLKLEMLDIMLDENAIPEPPKGTILHLFWLMMRPDPKNRPTASEVKKELERFLSEYNFKTAI